jgi:hypothetical protein
MQCITVRQPWAWAIFHGKDIENRDWPTRVRGRVAIHAAKGMTEQEYVAAYKYCEARGVIIPMPVLLFRGVVLGTVEIVDCVSSSSSPWFMGDYGFVLRNPMLYANPISAKGALGFWQWEAQP